MFSLRFFLRLLWFKKVHNLQLNYRKQMKKNYFEFVLRWICYIVVSRTLQYFEKYFQNAGNEKYTHSDPYWHLHKFMWLKAPRQMAQRIFRCCCCCIVFCCLLFCLTVFWCDHFVFASEIILSKDETQINKVSFNWIYQTYNTDISIEHVIAKEIVGKKLWLDWSDFRECAHFAYTF